jgi:uncharacterized membrane protein
MPAPASPQGTPPAAAPAHAGPLARRWQAIAAALGARAPLLAAMLAALVAGTFFSALIPPFQSPDEFDHIKRAYLLSKGRILLVKASQTALAGGMIDSGLLAYLERYQKFPTRPEHKLSRQERAEAAAIRWSGQETASYAAGTGYYFPVAYAPQTLGLLAGRLLDLTIADSYALARFLVLAASIAVIALALRVFPFSPLVPGLLILPMSVFQFSSASLDAFTTALTVLCAALFMRAAIARYALRPWMRYALSAAILILATSRLHLLPVLVLPLLAYRVRRDKALLRHCLVTAALALLWLAVVVQGSYVNRTGTDLSTAQIIAYYLTNPAAVVSAIVSTLLDENYRIFYRLSFIGILGWLDTSFNAPFYRFALVTVGLLALSGVTYRRLAGEDLARAGLAVVSFASVLLIFLALLVTWNPVPARVIEGVQGRYFLGPLLLLAYGLNGSTGFLDGATRKFGLACLIALAAAVVVAMPPLLVERYFMQ